MAYTHAHACTYAHTHTHTHTHTLSIYLSISLSLLSKSLTFPIPRESHESSAHDVFTFLITDWNFTFLCERICIKLHLWYKAVKFRESVWHVFDYGADKMFSERCPVYSTKCHVREVWTEKKNDETTNTLQGVRPILGSFAKTGRSDC